MRTHTDHSTMQKPQLLHDSHQWIYNTYTCIYTHNTLINGYTIHTCTLAILSSMDIQYIHIYVYSQHSHQWIYNTYTYIYTRNTIINEYTIHTHTYTLAILSSMNIQYIHIHIHSQYSH